MNARLTALLSLLSAAVAHARSLLLRDPGAEFTRIYANRLWSNEAGGSGGGSTVEYTAGARKVLYNVIKLHNVTTMVDAPCGSFFWLPTLFERLTAENTALVEYTGLDVVASVVAASTEKYAASANLHFLVADLTRDSLPSGKDLILSRDALQHLALEQVKVALRAFQKADPRLLLVGSYPSTAVNYDIETGDYNAINLMSPPFDLHPEEVYSEQTPDHKHLLLYTQEQIRKWRIL